MKKPTVRTAKKTPGTMVVEKYRPKMNKLTAAERGQLREFIKALYDLEHGRFVSAGTALNDVPRGA